MAIHAVKDITLETAHEVAPPGIKVTIVEGGSTHNTRLEPSPVVSQRYNESGIDPAQRAHAHDSPEGNDPGSESRLILSIAEMAELPVRLVVGTDATQHLTDTGQAPAGLEAKWRN